MAVNAGRELAQRHTVADKIKQALLQLFRVLPPRL